MYSLSLHACFFCLKKLDSSLFCFSVLKIPVKSRNLYLTFSAFWKSDKASGHKNKIRGLQRKDCKTIIFSQKFQKMVQSTEERCYEHKRPVDIKSTQKGDPNCSQILITKYVWNSCNIISLVQLCVPFPKLVAEMLRVADHVFVLKIQNWIFAVSDNKLANGNVNF